MVYGVSHICVLFRDFNKLYFGNILPMPCIRIRHSVNVLGYFSHWPNAPRGTTETIEISDFYDYTSSQLRDIVVHEMIHYYLAYTRHDIGVTHGQAFINKARELNAKYGLHVTPTIDLRRMKPRYNAPLLKKLYYKMIIFFYYYG